MKLKKNQAWHFIRRDEHGIDRLRDGTEAPPDGVWLELSGPLKMCESGLHFSRHPFDALKYAPGEILCLVEIGGTVIDGDDKDVCSRRRIIRRGDMADLLSYFARMQALSVVHLWNAPDVVLDYLMTGDQLLREAARDAARAAARAAARDAAEAAAWAATREARDAAREAAREARNAAWAAARSDFEALVMEAFS